MGRWKVTVRSARTAGSEGSPEDRSTAVGRVDGDDRDAGGAGAPDDRDGFADGLAEGAADAGAEEGIDDDRRLVDPETEHGDVAGDRGVDLDDAVVAGDAIPVPGRVLAGRTAVRGDHRDHDRGAGERQAAGGHVAVAAVVARAAQDDDGAASPSDRGQWRAP